MPCSLLQGAFEENILNGGGAGSVLIAIFASTVLIAALGTLFQWIYGLHYDREPTEPTAYIFVIDDSGSMESNDPDQLRYAAVNKVLEKKPADFPYMIYGFSNQVSILREMMPISDGAMDITGNNRGGTCIKKVMNQVIADYQNHIWEGGEASESNPLYGWTRIRRGLVQFHQQGTEAVFQKSHQCQRRWVRSRRLCVNAENYSKDRRRIYRYL